jgi:hypothetical protein
MVLEYESQHLPERPKSPSFFWYLYTSTMEHVPYVKLQESMFLCSTQAKRMISTSLSKPDGGASPRDQWIG